MTTQSIDEKALDAASIACAQKLHEIFNLKQPMNMKVGELAEITIKAYLAALPIPNKA